MEALLRFQKLVPARLLAYPHSSRRIRGIAFHVVDCAKPAGKKLLQCFGALVDDARTHRQQIDDLAGYARAVEERRRAGTHELSAVRVERDGRVDLPILE